MKGSQANSCTMWAKRRRGTWPPVAGESEHAMPKPEVRDSPQ